ncbi:MAG: BadF/BadG/BcrA/BcrD ATPase family protein [Actinomycetota bacterium]|nr:BadF/BadG/BcrA/BcrD ATPase family protein [Actinomycetota bacterium]
MEYVLGVDGGATKTVVQIVNLSGKVVSESEYCSSNFKSAGIKEARENLTRVVLNAIKKIDGQKDFVFKSACFGMAGYDTLTDGKKYHKMIFKSGIEKYLDPENTLIYNDTRIGLAASSNSANAIIIICGTGSNCLGVNERGKEVKVNGWDYILGDEGSGYAIGVKALKAVMRDYDGRGEETLLSGTIMEDLKIKSIPRLVSWAYGSAFFKVRIAALARTVCRTAEMGDETSIRILREEAGEAINSISIVVKKLGLAEKEFDLVFVGNVFKCDKFFKSVLMKEVKAKFKKVNFKPLTEKPVQGAVKFALDNI